MKKSELRNIVAELLEIAPESLSPETDLKSIDTFDSVNILSLMITLDEEAGIKLGPDEASHLTYYRDLETLAVQQGVELTDD